MNNPGSWRLLVTSISQSNFIYMDIAAGNLSVCDPGTRVIPS
jgi:hypothetical protein